MHTVICIYGSELSLKNKEVVFIIEYMPSEPRICDQTHLKKKKKPETLPVLKHAR